MHLYEYAFIRYVPKVEREEFINIGAVLYSRDAKVLEAKTYLNESRIKAFAPQVDIDLLFMYLSSWHLICQGQQHGGPIAALDPATRFRWLTANRSTIIQVSKLHPGQCSDPEELLERLFEEYVK